MLGSPVRILDPWVSHRRPRSNSVLRKAVGISLHHGRLLWRSCCTAQGVGPEVVNQRFGYMIVLGNVDVDICSPGTTDTNGGLSAPYCAVCVRLCNRISRQP